MDRDFPDEILSDADRVAALVAGDLDDADVAAVETAIAADPSLARERDFWRAIQATLPEVGHPKGVPVPGPGMASVVRQRLDAEGAGPGVGVGAAGVQPAGRGRGTVLAMASGWLVAAAACIALALVVVRPDSGGSDRIYVYDETGSALELDEAMAMPAVYRDASAAHIAASGSVRPWVGVWTQPIELTGIVPDRDAGLRVMRVVGGSPAAAAGLLPGDVILDLAGAPMSTRWCIPHAVHDDEPGTDVTVRFWRPDDAQVYEGVVRLGACYE